MTARTADRRMRIPATLGLLAVLSGCCTGSCDNGTLDQVTTRALTVVDESGRPRMRVRTDEGDVSISLLTREGHPRLRVALDKADLPEVYFLEGNSGITLELYEDYEGLVMRPAALSL